MQVNPQNKSGGGIGIIYMLLAMLIFSSANVIVKMVANQYSIIQIVFLRNVFALIPITFMVLQNGSLSSLKTRYFAYHGFCGGIGAIGLYALFTSFHLLPLAEATCLAYASILFVTAFSGPVLKEYVGWRGWVAVTLGFIGVIIAARPNGNFMNSGIFYSLAFSLIDAIVMLSARKLAPYDKPTTIVFYFSFFATLFSGLFVRNVWQTPSLYDSALFAAIGIGGGLGQWCLTQAYKHAPPRTVSPMIYSSMVWSIIFGYFFWHEIPTLHMMAGSTIIIGSGIFIVYQENRSLRAKG